MFQATEYLLKHKKNQALWLEFDPYLQKKITVKTESHFEKGKKKKTLAP